MADLGSLIDEFVSDPGLPRELRAALAHVIASDLALREVEAIGPGDVRELVGSLQAGGMSPERSDAVVDALRLVFAYGVGRRIVRASPLVGLASPSASASASSPASPSPTTAIVALGENLVTWTMRAVVVGFVLAAIGLVVALA